MKYRLLILISLVTSLCQGQTTFKNPILYADYSDPDVIRVGNDYWMTASSFNCSPGLPILHSYDMVHWTFANAALPYSIPGGIQDERLVQHGNQVWAPSIREHNGTYYIFWGDPDVGIYQVHTQAPRGEWSAPLLVIPGKGLIDATPLWDENGRVYLVHALAGSRAGLKSVLCVAELTPDCEHVKVPSRIIFDGHKDHPTCEGPKFYKRNGYYYIFTPAGGVSTGWQLVLRSKNVYGPYEEKIVLQQGKTGVNGPHQGAWVQTQMGQDWFYHFQDVGPLGRIVHLQPMRWVDDWPVMGSKGEPVLESPMPYIGSLKDNPTIGTVQADQTSDDFQSNTLGLQWQWQAEPLQRWYFCEAANGLLRLYSVPCKDMNLWNAQNLLLQKPLGANSTYTTRVRLMPDQRYTGERGGLCIMGMDYATLELVNASNGIELQQRTCLKANKGAQETTDATVQLTKKTEWVYLRVELKTIGTEKVNATFSYSIDNTKYEPIGKTFAVKEGQWIGAKVGLFCLRPEKPFKDKAANDGGHLDADFFNVN